jgi:4-amino-4-deoxy-L-arabinose transferase-like glycosyltransferase
MLNGVIWAAVTPPFQVPDEQGHVGYTRYLVETGRLPRDGGAIKRRSELAVATSGVPLFVQGRPTWSKRHSDQLFRSLGQPGLTGARSSEAAAAANNPPLYYALEAVPYRATRGLNLLDRVFFMRVLSALLAALTVACVFGFVRELLPSTPWAWTVGALAVAFQPVFGFMSGGVNNDNLLYTAGAALLFLLARAFRRGLTPKLGVAIGAVFVAGVLAKGTMLGLIPGAIFGVVLTAVRTPAERRPGAIRGMGLALGCVVVPAVVWLIANAATLDSPTTTVFGGPVSNVSNTSYREELSYLWQFFLPRLPWMHAQFDTWNNPYPVYPLWDTYFQGFIGRFGWFFFGFPMWVYWLALGIFGGVLALVGAALVRARATLRRRWPELVCYLMIVAGLVVLVGTAGYRYRATNHGINFEQARYLLSLLGLYGALIALAARGAGQKYGRAVGAFFVVLAAGHSLFSMLLTIGHFYA